MVRETRSNDFPRVLALLACLIGLVVSAFSLAELYRSYRLDLLRAPSVVVGDVLPFGINASLEDDDDSIRLQKLRLLQDGGFRWVRQRFPWREIEPAPRSFRWEKWDRLVDLYNQHGLEVVAVLDHPPAWSRQDNNWDNRPPDDFDDFGYFVHAFVTHFRGKVRYVQIWDEPNVFPNWGNRPVDPAGYATLLKIAYQNARAADPTVKVLSAGLAPNGEEGGRNMSDLLFLTEMYRHGAGRYLDILAVKPYGLWFPPEDRRVDDAVLNFSRVLRHRQISVDNGFANVPIWAVEFGWNSLPEDWPGPPSIWGATSEAEQASYTYQAYKLASTEWPWMQVMLLQGMFPERYPRDPLYGFSIVDRLLKPRPVYSAVKSLAITPLAGVGEHGPDSPYLSLSGTWRDEGSAVVGTAGSSLEIPFRGTRLDLLLWKTPLGPPVQVNVDGKPVADSPHLSGEGTLDLRAERARKIGVVAAAGLTDEDHVLTLQVMESASDSGRKPELRLEGFVVRRELAEPWMAILGAMWAVWTGVILWAMARVSSSLVSPARLALMRLHSGLQGLGDLPAAGGLALALAWLYLAPGLLASAVGLVFAAVLISYRLEIGLLFVLLSAPFYTRPKAFGGLEFSLVEILILICAFAYALRWSINRTTHGSTPARGETHMDRFSPPAAGPSQTNTALLSFLPGRWSAELPVLLFILVSLASLLVSTMPRESVRELRTVVVEPVLYYCLLAATLSGKRRALDLAHTLILAGFVISIVGLYQYAFTGDVITAEGVRRIRGFYGSPNNLGLFLGRVIPLALALAWLSDRYRRVYLVALAAMLAALLLSFSVGAWGAVTASALFVAAFAGRKAFARAAAGVAAVGLALVPVLQIERISSHLSLERGTTLLRLHIWQAALNMIRDNPLWGIGLDNFLYRYPRYMLPEAWREPNLSHPHNLVLDFWLRLGSLGLIVILWLLFRFFSSAARLYRRLDDSTSRALALGLMASMVDFVLHGLVDNSYFVVDLAIIFWATVAALRILERVKD